MKLKTITILASLTFGTSAIAANHAVLNVEGEIQINGRTVIDENGNFISANGSGKTINFDDYYRGVGKYNFKTTQYDNIMNRILECDTVYIVETDSNNATQTCGATDQDGVFVNDFLVVKNSWSYLGNDTARSEWSKTYSPSLGFDMHNDEGFEVIRVTSLIEVPDSYTVGQTRIYSDNITVIDSSYENDNLNVTNTMTSVDYFPLLLDTVIINNKSYNECLVIDSNGWQPSYFCKGLGYIDDNNYPDESGSRSYSGNTNRVTYPHLQRFVENRMFSNN